MKTKTMLALSFALATIGAFAANRVVDLGGGKHGSCQTSAPGLVASRFYPFVRVVML